MATIRGALRNITGASMETGVPVTTLREWDAVIQPIRSGSGPTAHRLYDDPRIAKIHKVAEQRRRPRGV